MIILMLDFIPFSLDFLIILGSSNGMINFKLIFQIGPKNGGSSLNLCLVDWVLSKTACDFLNPKPNIKLSSQETYWHKVEIDIKLSSQGTYWHKVEICWSWLLLCHLKEDYTTWGSYRRCFRMNCKSPHDKFSTLKNLHRWCEWDVFLNFHPLWSYSLNLF